MTSVASELGTPYDGPELGTGGVSQDEKIMGSKYWLDESDCIRVDGRKLYRILAVKSMTLSDGTIVRAGEKGGYVESTDNLSQDGNSWVGGDAKVYGDAEVGGDALVDGMATVSGQARVVNSAHVTGIAEVGDRAEVACDAYVGGRAAVMDDGFVTGSAKLLDAAVVKGHGEVSGNALLTDCAEVRGYGTVKGNTQMEDRAVVEGNASVFGNAILTDRAKVGGQIDFGTKDEPGLADPQVVFLSGTQHLTTKGRMDLEPSERVSIDMADVAFLKRGLVTGEGNAALYMKMSSILLVPGLLKKKIQERFEGIIEDRALGSTGGWSKEDIRDEDGLLPSAEALAESEGWQSEAGWKDFLPVGQMAAGKDGVRVTGSARPLPRAGSVQPQAGGGRSGNAFPFRPRRRPFRGVPGAVQRRRRQDKRNAGRSRKGPAPVFQPPIPRNGRLAER